MERSVEHMSKHLPHGQTYQIFCNIHQSTHVGTDLMIRTSQGDQEASKERHCPRTVHAQAW